MVAWSHEEVHADAAEIDDARRSVSIADVSVSVMAYINGSEQLPTSWHAVIPVTVDKDGATWRPDVVCRNPNPIRAEWAPVTGTPAVGGSISPNTWYPEVVLVWSDTGGTGFETGRRRLLILDGGLRGGYPESRDPVITLIGIVPVPRNPAAVLWWDSPDATDPNMIFALVVPGPVARDPDNVISFRFKLRRNFSDRLWRCLGNQCARFWVIVDLFGESLVDGTTSQNFVLFRGVFAASGSRQGLFLGQASHVDRRQV